MRFEVTAPLETIVGNTSVVSDHFHFDPEDVKASMGASFEVDVASFNTGIALRDEHFRDRFLHTDRHPKAVFTLDRIISASKKSVASGESVDLEIEGTLVLHGVKKKEQASATVHYIAETPATKKQIMPGNIIGLNASFDIELADYRIERPEMLVLKVGEVVNVDLSSRLSDAPEVALGCGGCGGSGCSDSCDGCGGCGG